LVEKVRVNFRRPSDDPPSPEVPPHPASTTEAAHSEATVATSFLGITKILSVSPTAAVPGLSLVVPGAVLRVLPIDRVDLVDELVGPDVARGQTRCDRAAVDLELDRLLDLRRRDVADLVVDGLAQGEAGLDLADARLDVLAFVTGRGLQLGWPW
jgi:hypothetical protein